MDNNGSVSSQDNFTPVANKNHSMWDAFEHIILFISLYIFATSFALLLHFFVDKWFMPINSSFGYNSYSYVNSFTNTIVRGYIAAIIVSYPFFAVLFLRLTKKTLNNPSLRKIKARKILIYFTLIVTFVISLVNFISIVYSLVSGNITLNFLLHFMVTFLVSGVIFLFYLNQVREDRLINE